MEFLILFLRGISMIVIVDAVASWFAGPDQFPRSLTRQITEPMYKPIRKVIDPGKMGGIDISPLIVLVALQGLASLIARSFMGF